MDIISKAALWLLLLCDLSLAGGRGGHNTTFDPNLFGGPANVSCLVGGSVAGVCNTGYSAVCDGVTDIATNINNWRTAAVAANPALAVLYIAPGSNCYTSSAVSFIWDNVLGNDGVRNLVVWGYGATINETSFSIECCPQNNLTVSRIATASAGATSITVTSGAAASTYLGRWISVTGLQTQNAPSLPPNFQWQEYAFVTNVSGSDLTLASPLVNSYKSTWPLYQAGDASHIDYGGPGTIYLVPPSWDTNAKLYGLTLKFRSSASEFNISGRNIAIYDVTMTYGTGFSPSATQNMLLYGLKSPVGVGLATEVDKWVENLTAYNILSPLIFQSSFPRNMILTGYPGNSFAGLTGTPLNITINNSTFPTPVNNGVGLSVGPNCYGRGQSILIDGASISSGAATACNLPSSVPSFSGGTFSIANTTITNPSNGYMNWGVPGHKYFFGCFSGSTVIHSSPDVTFTITDVRQDATNTFYDTDIGVSLPTPSCNGTPSGTTAYIAYPAQTIKQINSTGTDMTQFAPP